MTYILIKIVPDGNGGNNTEIELAISNSKKKLKDYSKIRFNYDPLNESSYTYFPDKYLKNDLWSGWLVIRKSNIKIL